MTWLSHALDCQLYGLEPAGHHLTSVLIHVINVLLLFLVAAWATGRMGRSFLLATLFALHPFNVESVAWIAERKNVLSMLFFLLALGAYGLYSRKPSIRRYLVVALMFALGLAAKPMVITLPFVLLLLDFWPLERIQGRGKPRSLAATPTSRNEDGPSEKFSRASFSWLVTEKLPLFALSAASAVITMIAQRAGASIQGSFSFGVRLENAVYAYAMYVWKTFWPAGFAIYYPHPGNSLGPGRVGLAAVFLGAVSFLVWRRRTSQRYLVTGWLWYLGTLVPMIGLVQVGNQAMADRYAYLPLIGIFVMVIWAASDLADAMNIGIDLRVAVAGLLIVVILPYLTWRQLRYWRNNDELWSHAAEVTQDNYLALLMLNRPEEALPGLQRAAAQNFGDPMNHVRLATAYAMLGRQQDAAGEFAVALQTTKDPQIQARIYESLATVYANLEDFAKVRESYRQALQIEPRLSAEISQRLAVFVHDQPTAPHYTQYAILLQEIGNLAEARAAYEQALQLDPALVFAKQALDGMGPGGR